jgi:hypothetical protein
LAFAYVQESTGSKRKKFGFYVRSTAKVIWTGILAMWYLLVVTHPGTNRSRRCLTFCERITALAEVASSKRTYLGRMLAIAQRERAVCELERRNYEHA